MILENNNENFNEVLQRKIDLDEFNDFILDFIKENKRKSINYYLDFKEKDDDIFTFEYQLQEQNQKIISLTKNKSEKNIFYLDLKDLKNYVKNYSAFNMIKLKFNIINPNKINKQKEPKSNLEELDLSIQSIHSNKDVLSNSNESKEYDSDNFFNSEENKNKTYNEIEFIEKFNNLFESHKKMKAYFKNLSSLCVNILIISFKQKFTFLDFSMSKRKIIKEVILNLRDFLNSNLNGHLNSVSDNIRKDFINLKRNHNKDKLSEALNYDNDNRLWEVYENHNLNESEDDDNFDLEEENHMFGRKNKLNKEKNKQIKFSERLLGHFLYNTCIADLSNFIM